MNPRTYEQQSNYYQSEVYPELKAKAKAALATLKAIKDNKSDFFIPIDFGKLSCSEHADRLLGYLPLTEFPNRLIKYVRKR